MIGILIDKSNANDLIPIVDKLSFYINNKIEYGRNRWKFQIHILNSYENNEIIKASNIFFNILISNLIATEKLQN